MNKAAKVLTIGNATLVPSTGDVSGKVLDIDGQSFYCIENVEAMPPFFISLVSSSDHWMFIASTGGVTAGRVNANFALFPYASDDKVTENHEICGSKTIFHITKNGKTSLWEPFSQRYAGLYLLTRNLYKNVAGTQLIFEEVNHDLSLVFRYAWRTSEIFGFVRTVELENMASEPVQVEVLDGVQYIQPFGILSQSQIQTSNLLNAYKRNELESESGIGMYTLSSTLSDMPEPNESLRATIAWQHGLTPKAILLSSTQVDAYRRGEAVNTEEDLRAQRGAYFVNGEFTLQGNQRKEWHQVMDVNQEITAVIALREALKADAGALWQRVADDVAAGEKKLVALVASSDGLQCSGDAMVNSHHFANTMFNIMRGGIFDDQYFVDKAYFIDYLKLHNRSLYDQRDRLLAGLPEKCTIGELIAFAEQSHSPVLLRLAYEYLPLTFSRRHGDPSRPWNQFSINLKNPDGSRKLDYQGNWRDIFQNWEPLAASYPEFIENMICKFLNATTGDGYNPYRLTYDGFEWEIPEPNDPWGNIGYWGDHQIIYLQKLLELSAQYHPGTLAEFLGKRMFVYANIPYRLRSFAQMLEDWYDTIDFDRALNKAIEDKVKEVGTDGKLLSDAHGNIITVSMAEKLFSLLLAKVVNLVPGGGIWMNTQRPEWNDANNALVGKGVSVVTAAYLYRYVKFVQALLRQTEEPVFTLSAPLAALLNAVRGFLVAYQSDLTNGFSDSARFAFMRDLGNAGTDFRQAVYNGQLGAGTLDVKTEKLAAFLTELLPYLEATLANNCRDDGMFHAYNVLKYKEDAIEIGRLSLMLEGQVAMLSSGFLKPEETLRLLRALRRSALYRAEQHSYILYPDRDLPGFLDKNVVPQTAESIPLLAALLEEGDQRLILRDVLGGLHFHGLIHNERDVRRILDELAREAPYADLVAADRQPVLDLFESVFDHNSFTGRSGTFFGYEGLGSIYWHMVSKLLLAVQENLWQVYEQDGDTAIADQLKDRYYDIRDGIGFNKSPAEYGSFPSDPYSHTPAGAGAKQPGMTGQVKEELMARWKELGVVVAGGVVSFLPRQLLAKEFLSMPAVFYYVDVSGEERALPLEAGSLGFTLCQVPVIYQRGEAAQITLFYADGSQQVTAGAQLSARDSAALFQRSGAITQLTVTLAN
jgi:hypothetical protein